MISCMQIGEEVIVPIVDLGHAGEGIGVLDNLKVFIEGALPGEEVQARIHLLKKNYAKATLLQIIRRSKARVDPPCPYFGSCGGCQIQHLAYKEQLEVKRKRVFDALKRIAHLENPLVEPLIPAPSPYHYRNKIQLPVEQGKIGLYQRNSHHLIDIKACLIHAEQGEEIFHWLRKKIHALTQVRHILIKSSEKTRETLVTFVVRKRGTVNALANELLQTFKTVKGIVENYNPLEGNVVLGKEYSLLAGQDHIFEELHGLKFKVSSASFFQVNPKQAENLYKKALEFANIQPKEIVLDAYSGVGTLTLLSAAYAKEVIGIEFVKEAVADAKQNAELNQIHNVRFIQGAIESISLPHCDVVILNPPRGGCAKSVLEAVIKIKPRTVIYISCDPATLARDIDLLKSLGYILEVAQPFDMFPETMHVETVAKILPLPV